MDTITAPSPLLKSGVEAVTLATEARSSAVSWAAVIGGAFVAAALSVVLLALGVGLGLSSVSPWSSAGASAATVGIATAIWLSVMQIIASGMGGYLAGRLRTKWVNVHTDEVFFRDTAHGFLVWAVGLVIVAAFMASAATSMIGGAVQTGATALSTAAVDAAASDAAPGRTAALKGFSNAYFVDTLLRSDQPGAQAIDASTRAEVGRILAVGLARQNIAPTDQTYLAKLVAAKTGLSQADAEQRVGEVVAQAKTAETEARQAADSARKAAAHLSLWTFISLLIGAFCASYAATIGGRQRDRLVL